MSDFDREIERELGRVLGPVETGSVPAFRAPGPVGPVKKILGGTGAAIAAKLVTGLAIGAFAAAGATEVAVTGSINPNDWGRQVVQQVASCKAALQPGQHGIGPCVSAFAKQHGAVVSADHRASGARTNGGDGKDNKGGNGKDHGKDHGKGGNGKGGDGKGGGGSGGGGGGGQPGDGKSHGKPTPQPEPGS